MAQGDVNPLQQSIDSATATFERRCGRPPRWIVAAPGRVNLIGEHVDYNDGFVIPMAIDRYCVIAADESPGDHATLFSAATNNEARISLAALSAAGSASATVALGDSDKAIGAPRPGNWSNYVAGVIALCAERGMRAPGFQAAIDSGVPFGSGLSSSASLEVATATLIEAITGTTLNPVDKALLCQKAEHEFAGVPCGIMDQFASAMCQADHLMLLDCRSQTMKHIPLIDPNITVLIINTNVKHDLSGGEYAERRAQCESAARKLGVRVLRDATLSHLESNRGQLGAVEYRRARHVLSEIERTVEAAAALTAGDWPRLGQLMYASHDSLRDDYDVSCRELDLLVSLSRQIGTGRGMIGSRMTGGGFGGSTVSLIETDKAEDVVQFLAKHYRVETGLEPNALFSRPARGAHVLKPA
jgi:galactokinase